MITVTATGHRKGPKPDESDKVTHSTDPRSQRLKQGAIVLVAIILAVATIMFGIVAAARTGNPRLALSIFGKDARALEALSDQTVQANPSRRELQQAKNLAIAAMRRDATSVKAIRTFGVVALLEGKKGLADRLMEHAFRLSRRDLPTTIYLIDQNVERDDIPGALNHFDVALRVSKASQATLFPILASALTDERLVAPLTSLFRRDPSWLPSFIEVALASPPSAVNLSAILARLKNNRAASNPHTRRVVLKRLVADGEYRAASIFYNATAGRSQAGLVTDGLFEREPILPPFDWSYESSANLGAYRVAPDDQRPGGLHYYVGAGEGGALATQLLMLPPGQYVLESLMADAPADSIGVPIWRIICAPPGTQSLVAAGFSASEEGPRATRENFTVPALACDAQWLSLEIRSDDAGGRAEGLINRIQIRSAPAHPR